MTRDTLRIELDLRAGGDLILVLRPGIVVDVGDLTVRRGDVRVRHNAGPDEPVILRAELAGRVRGGNVVARLPYRTFREWLQGKPRPYQAALVN